MGTPDIEIEIHIYVYTVKPGYNSQSRDPKNVTVAQRESDVYILLSWVDRVGIDWACCKHWAVIVEFDNRTIAYEITPLKDEKSIYKITPQWSHFQNNCRFNKMIFLGTIETGNVEMFDNS